MCVVGDSPEGYILDAQTGESMLFSRECHRNVAPAAITTLQGHVDFSFACAWSPDERIIATGNQDMTMRLYDIRNPSKAFAVLGTCLLGVHRIRTFTTNKTSGSKMGAVRSIRFSSDGRFLAMAEPGTTTFGLLLTHLDSRLCAHL